MVIKKINLSSFGKLKNKVIEPSDGITVIHGKNEAGKSTVCSFIKFTLFGFNGRSQSISDNDKKKYMPWDENRCAGSLDIDVGGKLYRIERENSSKAFSRILDGETGKLLYSDRDAGDIFLGVDENAFSKTAYIGQLDVTASRMNGLSNAIQNIIFSADETLNADTAKKKLNSYKNTLYNKPRRTGSVFELDDKISSLEIKCVEATAKHKELLASEFSLSDTSAKIAEKKALFTSLNEEKLNIEGYFAKQKLLTIEKANISMQDSLKKYNEEKKKLLFGSFYADKNFTDSIISARNAFLSAFENLQKAKEELSGAKSECENGFSFNERIKKLSKKFTEGNFEVDPVRISEEIKDLKAKKKSSLTWAIILTLLIVTLPFAVIFYVLYSKAKRRLSELSSYFDFESSDELYDALCEYEKVLPERKFMEMRVPVTAANVEKQSSALSEKLEALNFLFSKIGVAAFTKENAADGSNEKLNFLCGLQKSAEEAYREYQKCETVYSTLISDCDLTELSKSAQYGEKRPERDMSAVKRDMDFTEQSLALLLEREKELIKKTGMLATNFPKPMEIQSEIDYLEAKRDKLNLSACALELAINSLNDALDDIKNSASPFLTKRTSELFSFITENKYSALKVSPALELSFEEGDSFENSDSFLRSVDFLSTGAADAAYLCLRIALVEYLYKEKPALIFDEAFISLDDDRLKSVLNLILKLSEQYQIIIFTCHDREAGFLSGNIKEINL